MRFLKLKKVSNIIIFVEHYQVTVSEQIKNYDKLLLDFSVIFCVRYIYFGFLLKVNVLLANPSLVISEKYILKERNKYITSFCCEVIITKISAVLSSTMLLFLRVFCFIYIYKVVKQRPNIVKVFMS